MSILLNFPILFALLFSSCLASYIESVCVKESKLTLMKPIANQSRKNKIEIKVSFPFLFISVSNCYFYKSRTLWEKISLFFSEFGRTSWVQQQQRHTFLVVLLLLFNGRRASSSSAAATVVVVWGVGRENCDWYFVVQDADAAAFSIRDKWQLSQVFGTCYCSSKEMNQSCWCLFLWTENVASSFLLFSKWVVRHEKVFKYCTANDDDDGGSGIQLWCLIELRSVIFW